jgi:hypothetical protein
LVQHTGDILSKAAVPYTGNYETSITFASFFTA